MENADMIGYVAGFINMIHLVPQVTKSIKTKSTSDISINYAIMHVVGLLLWVVYGVVIMSYPIILVHIVESGLAIWIVALKIKFG